MEKHSKLDRRKETVDEELNGAIELKGWREESY